MDLSIIIVNFNVYSDVLSCIKSINDTVKDISYEIIVVDNNSSDREIEKIQTLYPNVQLILNKTNKGFGFANNIGMSRSSGNFILLVNPDIIFTDSSIEILYDFLKSDDKAGVAGPVQVKPNLGREYYYTFFPSLYSRLMQEFRLYMTAPLMKKRFFDFLDKNIEKKVPFEVDWVMGSCMMLKRELYTNYKGFDESLFLYEEETEWEFRIKSAGWKIFMHPGANVLHNHHSSASKLGVMFVHYHEFRSRIIFDLKRFHGLRYILRIIFIYSALCLRIMYFLPKSLFTETSKKKLKINEDLLKFSLKSRSEIINDKYDYDAKLHLFR